MSWTRRGYSWTHSDLTGARNKREHARLVWGKAVWIVSLLTGLSPSTIVNGGRPQDIAYARLMAMLLTHEYAGVGWSPVADVAGVDRTAIRNAVRRIPEITQTNAAVADVWRDARRIMDLEVRNAQDQGFFDPNRARHRDCADNPWPGAPDRVYPVRAESAQDAERPHTAGDRGEEVQAGRVAAGEEANVPGLPADTDSKS
jgi:hypothetical protein